MNVLFLALLTTTFCHLTFLNAKSQLEEQRRYSPGQRYSFQKVLDQILEDDEDENDSSGFDGSGDDGLDAVTLEQEYSIYRCRIKLADVIYDRSYTNRESQIFKDLSTQLSQDFAKIFPSSWRGSIKISVVQIRPSSDINTVVSVDIAALKTISSQEILTSIKSAIQNGAVGSYRVTPQEFAFGALSDFGGNGASGIEIVCKPDEFRCTNGQCIKSEFKCNQLFDCLDRSDENDCLTPSSPSVLLSSTDLTPSTGIVTDLRSPEATSYYHGMHLTTTAVPASPSVPTSTFSGSVPEFGISTAQTDPLLTPLTDPGRLNCHQAEFGCSDGTCIDGRLRCNYIIDCPDASDERDCAIPRHVITVTVEPIYYRHFQGTPRSSQDRFITVKCLVNGTDSYRVSWRRLTASQEMAPTVTSLPPGARQINQDLIFDSAILEPSYSGTYQCRVEPDDDVTTFEGGIDQSEPAGDELSEKVAIFKIDVIPRESTLPPRSTISATTRHPDHVMVDQLTTRSAVPSPDVTTSSHRGGQERESYGQDRRDRYQVQRIEYELKKEAYYRARTSSIKPRDIQTTPTLPLTTPQPFTGKVHRPILTNYISHQQPEAPPVEIFVRPRDLRLVEGGSGSIEVHVRSRDRNVREEEIAWVRADGRPLPADRIYAQYGGRRLVFRGAQTADSATYLCTVRVKYHDATPALSLEEKVVVTVKATNNGVRPSQAVPVHPYNRHAGRNGVTKVARLKVEPADLSMYQDEEARLTCQLIDDTQGPTRPVEVTWVRLSGRDSPKLPSKALTSGIELRVPNLNREDQGHYACTLVGDSSIRSVATLRVHPGQRPSPTGSNQARLEPMKSPESSEIERIVPNNGRGVDEDQDGGDGNHDNQVDVPHTGEGEEDTDKRSPPFYPQTRGRSDTLYRCEIDEATCQNGECIKRESVCDGVPNCSDGSDERNCPGSPKLSRDGNFQKYCEPNEYRCDNGRCVQKIWRCDGDDDCGDGSDERNCAQAPPGSPCKFTEYRCVSANQCIPSSYQCDGEIDCLDRSDEIGCAPPVVLEPPSREIKAMPGSTVEITCLATGTPVPLISWRLNWGHIPIAPRISSTSSNGRGTLTIRNVQAGDQGAYSCEAINNRDSILATPDAILTLEGGILPTSVPPSAGGRPICQPPYFNYGARSQSECLVCYCSGRTTQCYSSNQLFLSNITPRTPITSGTRDGKPLAPNLIQALPDGVSIQNVDPSDKPVYIDLPPPFLGNRLKSYGSPLKFNLYYTIQNGRQPQQTQRNKYATLILEGESNQKLYHHSARTPNPSSQDEIEIAFTESSFTTSPDPGYGGRVDRQTFMAAIKNVLGLRLLATYHPSQTQIRLTRVTLGDASSQDGTKGKTFLVEECRCPPGYSGLSCESCTPGYNLVKLPGQTLGSCISCACNGHSAQCDANTKACLNCQHNTEGNQCERCRAGYYGNAVAGKPDDCRPCACPLTNPTNNFSPTCMLDSDNQITCTQCPAGFTGRRCESCLYGYVGNPSAIGDTCRISQYSTPRYIPRPPPPTAVAPSGPCNAVGALNSNPDHQSGSCPCKSQTAGLMCDKCKPNAFHMSPENPNGCIGCFCMGLTNDCKSCRLYRNQQKLDLAQSQNALKVSTLRVNDRGAIVNLERPRPSNGHFEIRFTGDTSRSPTAYWELPKAFLGNRVTSYGGTLGYTLEVAGQGRPNTDPEVEIGGNNIHLIYDGIRDIRPNHVTSRQIKFYENYWKREDGSPANRENLMMALAGLNRILIKATYFNSTQSTRIKDITLDVADERGSGNGRVLASAVESCNCPAGYKGLSCEECAQGYTRTDGGLYLGSCQPCSCYRRSNTCNPVDGTCHNCENSEGPHCDRCGLGYYGAPGTPCKPCPCPPIDGRQSSCHVDVTDGQATCDKCPLGFTGRRCESCVPPFVTNPIDPEKCYIPSTSSYPATTQSHHPRPLDSRVSIIVNEPRHVVINEGDTATLTCTSQSAGSTWELEWSKQGGPLPPNTENVNGIFKISDVKPRDSGIYVCSIRGAGPNTPQATARVDVRGTRYEPLKIFISPTLINANAGDSGSFKCNIQGVSPEEPGVNVKWYKHNGNLPRDHRIKGTVLEFQNLVDSDSGLYVCEVSGPIGHYRSTARLLVEFMRETTYYPSSHYHHPPTQAPLTPYTTATVYHVTSITPTSTIDMVPPSVNVRPRDISLSQGSSATITCDTSGYPEPRITWLLKDGQPINSKHQVYLNKLRLLSVDVADSGTYVCRASNTIGSAKGEIKVNVIAPQPPQLVVTPVGRVQNLKVGGSVQFECALAPGQSGTSVTWVRSNGREIVPDTTQVSGRLLRFRNVSGKEKGEYQCTSTNSAGTSRQAVTLNIEGIPLVTITPTSPIRVLEGDMVSFECTAEGDPLPSVQWVVPKHIEVENPLEENQETRRGDIPSASAIFEITHVEKNDAGRYTCLAKNALGQTEETLELIVEDSSVDVLMDSSRSSLRVRPVKIEPDFLNLRNGATAQYKCIVSGHSQYRVEWKRAGGYKLSPKSYTAEQGHKLIIPNVSGDDKGDYLCYVHLVSGGYVAATAKLSVSGNVELSVSPSTQTVEAGQTFRIACSTQIPNQQPENSVYGTTTSAATTTPNRLVTLQWYRSGPDGGLVPLRRGAIDYSGLLEVRSAIAADSGNYVCTVSDARAVNGEGNVMISAIVNVIQPGSPWQEATTTSQSLRREEGSNRARYQNLQAQRGAPGYARAPDQRYGGGSVEAPADDRGGRGGLHRYSLVAVPAQDPRYQTQEESIRNGQHSHSYSSSVVGSEGGGSYGARAGPVLVVPSSRRVDGLQILRGPVAGGGDKSYHYYSQEYVRGQSPTSRNHSFLFGGSFNATLLRPDTMVGGADPRLAPRRNDISRQQTRYRSESYYSSSSSNDDNNNNNNNGLTLSSQIRLNHQQQQRQQQQQRPQGLYNGYSLDAAEHDKLLSKVPTTYSRLSHLLLHGTAPRNSHGERISVTPNLVANEGSDVELLCQFWGQGTVGNATSYRAGHLMTAHGDVKYTWTKVNSRMPNEFSRINGLLRIKNIKKSDSGTYSCKIIARGYPTLVKDTYIYVVPNDNRYRRGSNRFV